MRILTVRQPWAWSIIHGGKDVENRVRNIAGDYRGPVAIHVATASPAYAAEREVERILGQPAWSVSTMHNFVADDAGHIIGVVDLVDVHTADDTEQTKSRPGLWPTCSPWAERAGYHLVLSNPRPLAEPIPYKGALGLRRFNETVDAEVLHTLAEVCG